MGYLGGDVRDRSPDGHDQLRPAALGTLGLAGVRALRDGGPAWLWVGAAAGVGMQVKTPDRLRAGRAAGRRRSLGGPRRALASRWPWVAACSRWRSGHRTSGGRPLTTGRSWRCPSRSQPVSRAPASRGGCSFRSSWCCCHPVGAGLGDRVVAAPAHPRSGPMAGLRGGVRRPGRRVHRHRRQALLRVRPLPGPAGRRSGTRGGLGAGGPGPARRTGDGAGGGLAINAYLFLPLLPPSRVAGHRSRRSTTTPASRSAGPSSSTRSPVCTTGCHPPTATGPSYSQATTARPAPWTGTPISRS